MTDSITPPPDHDLPGTVRNRQRDELVAIVDHEAETPRRRLAVPLLAAAAVLVVVAGLAVAVPALRDKDEPAPAATPPKVAVSKKPPVQPAKTRQLSAAQTAAFRSACITFTQYSSDSFASYEVIEAFEYVETARPSLAKGWLVARKGMDYWICARDGRGSVVGDSGFGPVVSPASKDVPYLFAPVDQRGVSSGMYIPSITRVTVQHTGEAVVEAVLKDGFWFAPMADAKLKRDGNGQPVRPDNGLIGVAPGWTIRGYDDAKLVYDSAKNGPSVKKCYSNPAVTEVVVINAVKNPTPTTCQKMFDWR
jgi:hypothetical protein